MTPASRKSGYILLISILIIGTIASAVVVSMVLLGTGAARTAFAIEQSARAIALSQACSEYALLKLRTDPSYGGNEMVSAFTEGQCEILKTGGAGNNNRILCSEAVVGTTTRRMEIIVQQLLPRTLVYSWQEVPYFSLCE